MNKILPKIYTIDGTDANRLMRGEWNQLYKEKKGKAQAESVDLSKKLEEHIDIVTKEVNLNFLQYELEEEIIRDVDVQIIEEMPFVRSSLDGMTEETQIPCEAKHTHQDNRMEIVAESYYPKLQHYMMHCKIDSIYLSVIFGNRRFEYTVIDADYTYQKKLLAVEEWFYQHLIDNKEPTQIDMYIPQVDKKGIKLDIIKPVDMMNIL